MLENELKKYGFSKNEVAIYLLLAEKGKMRAGEIIKQTKVPRSVVYEILEGFIRREFVTKTEQHGVAVFSANDPHQLLAEVENRRGLASQIVHELLSKQKEAPREVAIYEGLDGIAKATDKNLLGAEGETIYILGASQLTVQPELDQHWQWYHEERAKKKINFKVLYDKTVSLEYLEDRNKMPLCEARYLPFNMEMPVWFNICADRLAIMIPGDVPPLVFSIRSRAAADAMKKYFNFFWDLTKPLPPIRQGMTIDRSD